MPNQRLNHPQWVKPILAGDESTASEVRQKMPAVVQMSQSEVLDVENSDLNDQFTILLAVADRLLDKAIYELAFKQLDPRNWIELWRFTARICSTADITKQFLNINPNNSFMT